MFSTPRRKSLILDFIKDKSWVINGKRACGRKSTLMALDRGRASGHKRNERFGLKGQGASLPPSPCTTRGGSTSVGGGISLEGLDFCPYLVDGWWGWHGGWGEPKVSSSLNHGLLQSTSRLFQRQLSYEKVPGKQPMKPSAIHASFKHIFLTLDSRRSCQ